MVINRDPYGGGWMIKVEVSNLAQVEQLLNADGYKKIVS